MMVMIVRRNNDWFLGEGRDRLAGTLQCEHVQGNACPVQLVEPASQAGVCEFVGVGGGSVYR